MSKQIQVQIVVDGKEILQFNRLELHQQFFEHHTFELEVNNDALEEKRTYTLQSSQELIGKPITIMFGEASTSDNIFKGVVTQVGMSQNRGLWGNLVLKGSSPTILLEGGKHHASYYKETLESIVKESLGSLKAVSVDIENQPKYKAEISYQSQYGESHFAFVKRLATDYGEWFYYNGETLFFGKPSKKEQVKLLYGSDIESMDFSMKVVPGKVNHFAYNSADDDLLTGEWPETVNVNSGYIKKAIEASNNLYKQPVVQPVPIRASRQFDLDQYSKNQKYKAAASTVNLLGRGDNPKVGLGKLIEVKVPGFESKSNSEDHGEYLVTKVSHSISGVGNYENTFEAIPAVNEQVPVEAERPIAQTQIATVKDNDDPKKIGRVRVQMYWQQQSGQMTDWLRVMTPDGGGSDKVSSNRGFVFIPEVGDQVVVGFRYNDPNRPFVLGSMFHGKNGGGGGSGNNSKGLTTKGGSTIMLDESKNNITISDPSGNKVTLNGDGTITIDAPNKIDIKSKEININGETKVKIESKEIIINGTNKVSLDSKEITVDGSSKTTVNSKAKVEIGAPSTLLEGKTSLKLTSSGILDVDGTTMTNVKGGMLNLNCG